MLRRALLLPFLAGVLALAGCGGGGGSSSSAGGLTKAQYAAKVSRLCLLAADQFRELHLAPSLADYKSSAARITSIDKGFAGKLAALQPPASLAADATAFANANAKVAQDDQKAIAAAKAHDWAGLHAAIKAGNRDNTATYPSARKIGAKGCYF